MPASPRLNCRTTKSSWASAFMESPDAGGCKLASADEITEMLMEPILSDLPFKKGDDVLCS